MESSLAISDAEIVGIRFGLASHMEICTASISGYSINHPNQISNPFLGLPLESGKCESCGTSEPGKCEGHFGYIELPLPIYHPSHITELKRLLSLLCLKCLKMKDKIKNGGIAERLLSACCEDCPQVSIKEVKTTDGACYLELKVPSRSKGLREGLWNFLERYGFRYGDGPTRPLLPREVMEILKRIPSETRKKLSRKGYFPQDGYILHYLPVPPNCLSVPDISDGVSIMSSDPSISMLKRVFKEIEIIKSSRSGMPNFVSQEVEANELQLAVDRYFQVRCTAKTSRSIDSRFGIKDAADSSTKAWLEKMRTLFIKKGSGFCSRSVITGDPFRRVDEIGIPSGIAQRITFEEVVNEHNMQYLQNLVDNKLCLTYKDGYSTYSLREGSKGHTFLRCGQVVHRRIMDGDMVFINRPPTTHKHSLQALSVYVHDDHTVKINPLMCSPLSADFDGDCIHLFYPQSLEARAEAYELFSVEKQLLSSHNGNLNLQLSSDSLLSLKTMFRTTFFEKTAAQQLSMFLPFSLPQPVLMKGCFGPQWTSFQILQAAFPACFDYVGNGFLISGSEILEFGINRDLVPSLIDDIVTHIFFEKGPQKVLSFFDCFQPLLMENLFAEGFSVSLKDFSLSMENREEIQKDVPVISHLLEQLRSTYNELVELQMEHSIQGIKSLVSKFILRSSALGDLIDSKSESSKMKIVQQIGFLGIQISDRGKLYSRILVDDTTSYFQSKYPFEADYPSAKFGFIKGCFFHGLDPYEALVHSISSREVIVRSTRGLSEPGTLFKNLMAILRDIVICYDGTVRDVCSNSIIQFDYGLRSKNHPQNISPPGEPVGALAATAMSNPAYKAVLDSTPSSNCSWELMKEILLCKVGFKNDPGDRRVILYLNDCGCGRKYCQENAAYLVKNQLTKVKLKDIAVDFMIDYKHQPPVENSELVGHVHLNKVLLKEQNVDMQEVVKKCQSTIDSFSKKKKVVPDMRKIKLSCSECCLFQQSCADLGNPCLMFSWQDANDSHLKKTVHNLADMVYTVLQKTVIRGDPRISSANITWVTPSSTTWVRSRQNNQKGELALDVALEKSALKKSGDAWRIVLDSCLPVLHLIDTSRSIPYAIKQVQELLGISCVFEQVVQRLSTSVSMVAKGILIEHLVLLANSMTCAGNLVGFNIGGFKSRSRSLNVQVPFTEATLVKPRKCFERAAAKCHVDSLSSVVASCSWGKHVAVGTGSRFDILWDRKEVAFNQDSGMDVYNFLHMVSGIDGRELNTGFPGAEVDNLVPENEMAEWALSPEHEFSSDNPAFEDSSEFENLDNQPLANWDKVTNLDKGSCESGGWDAISTLVTKNDRSSDTGGWSASSFHTRRPGEESSNPASWDAEAAWREKTENGDKSGTLLTGGKQTEWSNWRIGKSKTESFLSTKEDEPSMAGQAEWSSWGTNNSKSQDRKPGEESSNPASWDAVAAWGKKAENGDKSGTLLTSGKQTEWSNWGIGKSKAENVLSMKEDGPSMAGQAEWSSWGTNNSKSQDRKPGEESSSPAGWDAVTAWGKKAENGDKSGTLLTSGKQTEWSNWGIGKSKTENVLSTKEDGPSMAGQAEWSSWGTNNSKSQDRKPGEESSNPAGWDAVAAWGKKAENGDKSGTLLTSGKQTEWSNWGIGKSKTENVLPTKEGGPSMAGQAEWSSWETNNSKSQDILPARGWGAMVKESCNSENLCISSAERWSGGGTPELTSTKPQGDDSKASGWHTVTSQVNNSVEVNESEISGAKTMNKGRGQRDLNRKMAKDKPRQSASDWDSSNAGDWSKDKHHNHEIQQNQSSWLPQKSPERSDGWGSSKQSIRPSSSPGWGMQDTECCTPTEKDLQWGQQRGGRPWASDAVHTMTRQRLDMFTSEEQDILSDVETRMKSIRRILHQSGYNDGDPLSADDQTFVLDNILAFHPDKEAKMGGGIDYFTVDKHNIFSDTKCFYVITKDGFKHDFSYRKCLDNFIRKKYPEVAEPFIAKYFRKPSSRGNREGSQSRANTPSSAMK